MKVRDGGAPLKRKRKTAGLTQRELAYLVNRTDTTIWMLETGRMTQCSPDLAIDIARRLRCDVEDLFDERRSVPSSARPTPMSGTGSAA